jgi:hypothetical protein
MTRLLRLGVLASILGAPAASLAAQQPCAGTPEVLAPDFLAQAHQVSAYPTFCSIPLTPAGVRAAPAFKSAVVDTRVAGARVVARTAPSTFTLDETDQFAAAARAEAAPPPPMTTPDEAATEDFATKGRERVKPPARPH